MLSFLRDLFLLTVTLYKSNSKKCLLKVEQHLKVTTSKLGNVWFSTIVIPQLLHNRWYGSFPVATFKSKVRLSKTTQKIQRWHNQSFHYLNSFPMNGIEFQWTKLMPIMEKWTIPVVSKYKCFPNWLHKLAFCEKPAAYISFGNNVK